MQVETDDDELSRDPMFDSAMPGLRRIDTGKSENPFGFKTMRTNQRDFSKED